MSSGSRGPDWRWSLLGDRGGAPRRRHREGGLRRLGKGRIVVEPADEIADDQRPSVEADLDLARCDMALQERAEGRAVDDVVVPEHHRIGAGGGNLAGVIEEAELHVPG